MFHCWAFAVPSRGERRSTQTWAMAAARRVVEEVLGVCRQAELLALNRWYLSSSAKKSDLIADLAAECDSPASRQHICSDVLATWNVRELRSFIARLKGLGRVVAVGQQPRQRDLAEAIINTREHAANVPAVGTSVHPIFTVSHVLENRRQCARASVQAPACPRTPGRQQSLIRARH